MSKIMAMLLAMMLLLGTGAQALADAADGQVEYAGGEKAQTAPYEISWSKQVTPVTEDGEIKENFFDITLTASTKRHKQNTDTDVVIVMDVSNTMNQFTTDGKTPRIDAVKAAVSLFLEDYGRNTTLTNKRIGLVTFNTNAQTVLGLTEVTATNSKPGSANGLYQKYVKNITTPDDEYVKFTNIEGGLKLAHNILAQSDAPYKYVILLTDGFPTTYIQSGGSSTQQIQGYDTYLSHASQPYYENGGYKTYRSGHDGKDGYFANKQLGKTCWYGVDYSDRGAKKAQAAAKAIKDDKINIFTIGVALGEMSIQGYIDAFEKRTDANGRPNPAAFTTVDTTGMRAGDPYVIGDNANSYRAWLRDSISGGRMLDGEVRYLDGDNTDALKKDIGTILDEIEIAPVTTLREFWADDPMGEHIQFIRFYDKDGHLAGPSLSGESKPGAEDTAVYHGGKDRINWNLIQSGFTSWQDAAGTQHFDFDVKYRIRLMNENAQFRNENLWDTALNTNRTTYLSYHSEYPDGSTHSEQDLEYPIPQVEGYYGSLKLKKLAQQEGGAATPLAGVRFHLRHSANACSVCDGLAGIPDDIPGVTTGVTDEDGLLELTDIPSGHDYMLIEENPSQYKPAQARPVFVRMGRTYVDNMSKELTDGKIQGEDFTIINTTKEPVELILSARKQIDGKAPEAGKYHFLLTGVVENGAQIRRWASNDENGVIRFEQPIVFGGVGAQGEHTYYLQIAEVVGEDAGTVYDDEKIDIKIEITEDNKKDAYHAEVYVKKAGQQDYVLVKSHTPTPGDAQDRYTEVDVSAAVNGGYTFTNSLRAGAKATIAAKKTMLSRRGEPVDDLSGYEFCFELEDEQGKTLTQRADADGTVSFSMSYDRPGVYAYTLTEVTDPAAGCYNPNVVYDHAIYDVTVTVEAPDTLTDGDALAATVEYVRRGEKTPVASPVFVNRERLPGYLTLQARKTMDGKTPEKGAFTFELLEVIAGSETLLDRKTNDAKGVITFDEITYDHIEGSLNHDIDAHTYIIREVMDAQNNSVLFDRSEYYVMVTVSTMDTAAHYIEAGVHRKDELGQDQHITLESGTELVIGLEEGKTILFENETIVIDLPQTGDESVLLLWAALGACGLALALILRKKK